MFDDVLRGLAENKEWGLIILLVAVLVIWGKSVLHSVTKSLHDRDRINGEREERLIRVLIGFSESIPKLNNAIDDLRRWLGERFDDVDEDLEELKREHTVISAKVVDHEGRIVRLENKPAEPHADATAGSCPPVLPDPEPGLAKFGSQPSAVAEAGATAEPGADHCPPVLPDPEPGVPNAS